MKRFSASILAVATIGMVGLSQPAFAQESTPNTIINFPVSGFVNRLCSVGAVSGGNGSFALGSLIDPTSGQLSSTLSAPAKVVTGSWCNAPSTVSIAATQLTATGFTGAAPAGFTSTVDFTADAAGWTTSPASFATGLASNTAATQSVAGAVAGPITIGIGTFAPRGGANLRPVAAAAYSGQVVLTLAVVP